jgi:ATP-dependent DNA ligase
MEARLTADLPTADGPWLYEPKWDGFRCVAYKSGRKVDLRAKSGKPLQRYFPEVVEMVRSVGPPSFVVDGELVIEIDGRLAFDALQMRLHPAASRIKKLSAATPARFVAFDLLKAPNGRNLMGEPLSVRRKALEEFMRENGLRRKFVVSPATRDVTKASLWLADEPGLGTDGVVAKRLDDAYAPGERVMIKVKRLRSADCVVGGFRYQSKRRLVGSLLLGLYNDEGKLDHVGFTSTITDEERPSLTQKLERLRAEPGFTGKSPDGPSRWSTERTVQWEPLRPRLVVEVRFDHVTGGRFRHGTKLLRWRPDKTPKQCTKAQLTPPKAG